MDTSLALFRGILGLFIWLFICFLLSNNRKAINWTLVFYGLGLQLILALLLLKVPFIRGIFQGIVDFFVIMIDSSGKSAQFLFGNLAFPNQPFGFAFYVLPIIVFFSALSSMLYYFGILQRIVYGFAWLMKKTMKLSGAESLAAAANVFIGQTEAPIVVKPYLEKMTKSEIMCLMTGGMATIAGSVFGAYMGMLGGDSLAEKQTFGMHLLVASIVSAPAAIVTAKILFPETEKDKLNESLEIPSSDAGNNFLDSIARGTTDGLRLAVNVGAMLLTFMAFIYLINASLGSLGEWTKVNHYIGYASWFSQTELSLELIFGLLFSPFAWTLGIDASDLLVVGQLLGEKTILNEFVAYASLADLKSSGVLSDRSILISTYALCGFANFASIGIQIGGIGAIAPGQRKNLTAFGFKALIGGTIACFMTAIIAGMLIN